MKYQINNRKELKPFRKELRNNSTPAEATLWKYLQRSQQEGRKFRRQHSVGNYILDFYCPTERLCIELDGAGHFTDAGFEYDEERTAYLSSLNIKVVRFENKLVFENLEGVLQEIRNSFRILSPLRGEKNEIQPPPALRTPPETGGEQ
jgi:very-short-patch-repair endonuclease